MNYLEVHPLKVEVEDMIEIQTFLRNKIQIQPLPRKPDLICGIDISYCKQSNYAVAAAVVMEYATLKVLETKTVVGKVNIEYQSGFLAFRELPLILSVWNKLEKEPDVVCFDGNGLLHPQRMGIATHASFFLKKPTIGIGKNPFIGKYHIPNMEKGAYNYVYDREEIIGAYVRTKTRVKPVFISIGNYITLEECIEITLHTSTEISRIPQITRLPDKIGREICRTL